MVIIIRKHLEVYGDEPSLTDADAIQDFTSANQNSKSFNLNLNKK